MAAEAPLPPPLPSAAPAPAPNPPVTAVLPRPWARRSVLIAALLLFVAGTIGSNIGPALLDDHPLTVLVLSSRNRNLLGSVPFIDPAPYAVAGFFRVLAAGIVLFLIGRWYGTRGIGWVEGQVGEVPATIRWTQRAIDRAGWPLVLLMPGSNIVCLMVGQRRYATRPFLAVLCLGIALKLAVLWVGGKLLEDQIRAVLEVIDRYQWWVVIGLFAFTFVHSFGRVRKAVPEVIDEIEQD
jgi:membrane protein DedA with SNARE-associated domain